MRLINAQGEYPRHIGDIQLENPDWEEGNDLPAGWTEVFPPKEKPVVGEFEVAEEQYPIEVDGVMVENWTVRPMTEEEIEFKQAPMKVREKLLSLGLTEVEIMALRGGMY